MKYKLIKNFPGSDKLGSIYYKGGEYYTHGLKAQMVESNPEFFAPYLFTTEDGVDIYKGDVYWLKTTDNRIVKECPVVYNYTYEDGAILQGQLTFSTREAAQKWIDSQRKPIWKTEDGEDVFKDEKVKWVMNSEKETNGKWKYIYDLPMRVPGCATTNPETYRVFKNEDKMNAWIEEQNKPKFEKGEWLYYNSGLSKTLFRFLRVEDNKYKTTEGYQIMVSGNVIIHNKNVNIWSTKEDVTKATSSQIEEILSKVALHKGFKEGVKYQYPKKLDLGKRVMKGKEFSYVESFECLSNNGNYIYDAKDGWAEIVEDVPKYVEVLKSSCPLVKGDICKVVDGIVESHRYENKNGYLKYQYPDEHLFKPSTKEAYDAQFTTKEVTITLDGDVVNTSHWGNNVKIVYK